MKSKFCFFIIILFLSVKCTSSKNLKTYTITEIAATIDRNKISFIDSLRGGHQEIINGYHLDDSTIFYFGRGKIIYYVDDKDISKVTSLISTYEAYDNGKILEVKGKQAHQRYWKHKMFGRFFIGYSNASKKERYALDKIINSVKDIVYEK